MGWKQMDIATVAKLKTVKIPFFNEGVFLLYKL